VYAWRWTEKTKKIFKAAFPVTICDYELPDFVPLSPYIKIFTPALFARFEAFDLLQRYERVICMDSDIFVQQEMASPLSKINASIALTLDDCPAVRNNFSGPVEGYDLSVKCYNAGFIVLRNPLPAKEIHPWLYRMLAKYAQHCYLGDQGIVNLMLQEFHLTPQELPQSYNQPASSPNRILHHAYIIHAQGHRKFWCYYYFNEWYNFYTQWLALGGSTALIRKNTLLWDKLLKHILPSPMPVPPTKREVFWLLAPDAQRYPGKFLLFTLKRLFRVRY
jgi:lipopolysaccharide biosynthesis glycosyltransferase